MRRALILPAAIVVLAGPFVAGYVLSRPDRATTPVALPSLVDEVREALAGRYYRPVSAGVLHLDSVSAMLSALRDPYTAYLTPLSYRLVRHDTAASYSGIGVVVLPTERGLVVVAVPQGPAALRRRRAHALSAALRRRSRSSSPPCPGGRGGSSAG